MTYNFNHPVSTSTYLTANHVPRPRLDEIFNNADNCSLIYVIAGSGYGKTQAVRHYIEQQEDSAALWMQITDSDNIDSRYWESFTHTIAAYKPDFAAQLREMGFPETLNRFKQFAELLKSTKRHLHKLFFVLDDFHLIHSKSALTFAERCVNLQIPGTCIVIISRTEPDINIVPLISKNKVSIITEDELRFTAAETTEFFHQQSIPISQQNLLQTVEATSGWPLAINMLSSILKRTPNSLKYALDAMTQNIFKLLEIEAWENFPEDLQKTIVKISLLSDLPAIPLQELLTEAVPEMDFLQSTPGLASFIWFSSFTDDLKIHPLYLEFLQNKQHVLSEQEKQETYQRAAKWCAQNDFYTDAMAYYAKLGQYENMIHILLSYPFKLPSDTSEYYLNIIDNLNPNGDKPTPPTLLILKNCFTPLLLVGAGRYEEARDRALAVISEWEHVDNPFSVLYLYSSYSNLAYIDMYLSTFTHQYNSATYLKKWSEHYKLSTITPAKTAGAFINADMRSFACIVGEGVDLDKIDEFLNEAKQLALVIEDMSYDIYAGYEDLLICEHAFYRNQPELAKNHAHNAIIKAREKKQYSIAMMAEHYLLRMAVLDGNPSLARELMRHMQSYLDNTDFWNRHTYYDLYTGAFYALIGLPAMFPKWLTMDEKETASEIRFPSRELNVSAMYYISSKKYQQALTFLSNSYPREPHERFLFGELKLTLLTAIARIRTGDTPGAIADFEKAYHLSFQGEFEMFFVERGKELHPLVVAATNHPDCIIPPDWLKLIDRKASIYAKKAAVIANAFKGEHDDTEIIPLSDRETEVLVDLYHGLSRDEIAANRYLSINTVKKILQSIYLKLDAHNNVDAVRIALEKKLIE